MKKLKNFKTWKTPILEAAHEEDEWIVRKLRDIIKRAKRIPQKQRWHILVGLATTLLTLNSVTNLDYLVKSIASDEFTMAFKKAKTKSKIPKESTSYTILDLNNKQDYQTYAEMCQIWIDKQTYNLLNINGYMLAKYAKNAFNEKGNYVPPELALSQLTWEGGFSADAESRPIKTKNPFNVGNVDSGEDRYLDNVEDGIKLYYNLIAGSYLDTNTTVEDLLQNFVRTDDGSRYAKNRKYESKLSRSMKQIKDYVQKKLDEKGY